MRTLIMDMGLKVDKHDEIEEESSSGSSSSSGSGNYVNVDEEGNIRRRNSSFNSPHTEIESS